MKHEPSSDLLQFLRSKNILPNGYFSLEEPDGTYTFYSVSRSACCTHWIWSRRL